MKKIILIGILFYSTNIFGQFINDQSYLDPSFIEFKFKLEAAIFNKDKDRLAELMHDTILESNDGCGFPGCSKSEYFKYHFTNGKADEEWNDLKNIIRFGFTKRNPDSSIVKYAGMSRLFVAPSFIYKVSNDTDILALGENINIRAEPGKKGKVLTQVSWGILSCKCLASISEVDTYMVDEDDKLWLKVTYNGITGYIFYEFTSDRFDTFISVGYLKGQWKIISIYTPPGC